MPVAIGAQRQILDEIGENLLVLVALADEFSDPLEIVVARRRQDRASHAATEQYPAMRNDGLVEAPPGLVDSGNGGLDLLVHREEQIFLGREVIVQRTGQNARRGSDIANRRAFKSIPRKQFGRCGKDLPAAVGAFSQRFRLFRTSLRAPQGLRHFFLSPSMMKNPAANIRSGKLPASVRLGRSAETNLMDLNGWSISTLLEGYCRESIKRPIGAITLTITRTPIRLKWQG